MPANMTKGICGTRALKNLKYLQQVAPHIMPAVEPPEGFGSIIPFPILAELHRPDRNEKVEVNAELAALLKDVQFPSISVPVASPLFSGRLYFVQIQFVIQNQNNALISVSNADMATAISYATKTAPVISQYARQYGVNSVTVDPVVYLFNVNLQSNTYNDSQLQTWVNAIAAKYSLLSDTFNSCVVVLNPPGVVNTSGPLSAGVLGYHLQANVPYCFVNIQGQNLTIADQANQYATALSHEIAEMVVDPLSSSQNPEVCDPCGPNCQSVFLDYFDNSGNYIATSQALPPNFPYNFFINGIVQPASVTQCPAPASACNYSPLISPRVPIRSSVGVVSRNTNKLDIFVTDVDRVIQTAAWQPDFAGWWHGWWNLNGGRATPGAPVTCVSRSTDVLNVFVVGLDNRVETAWKVDDGDWSGWSHVGDDRRFLPGTAIYAVSRSENMLDIFGTDVDGKVVTSHWESGFVDWDIWREVAAGRAAPGAPVTCVSRNPDSLNVFVVGRDNRVETAWKVGNGDWSGWSHVGDARQFPTGTVIYAVSRNSDSLDIFGTDVAGKVVTARWELGFADWDGWRELSGGLSIPGAPVTAVVSSPDKLDVFVVAVNRQVHDITWELNSGWHIWKPIGNLLFAPGAPVTCESRNLGMIDIFAIDPDGTVQTAAWQPGDTAWRGWWQIGR
jgi:hypothetical protein